MLGSLCQNEALFLWEFGRRGQQPHQHIERADKDRRFLHGVLLLKDPKGFAHSIAFRECIAKTFKVSIFFKISPPSAEKGFSNQ